MQIFINDTPYTCEKIYTLTELLARQGIQPVNIAIAINNTVIPIAQWDTTVIRDNSNIIIIKAVQGG